MSGGGAWSRRTILAGALAAAAGSSVSNRLSVSKKGGRFRSIQEAVDAIPRGSAAAWQIEIAPGRYTERVTIPRDKSFISLIGQDAATTVLTYSLSTATTGETRYSASTYVFADNFQASNLTFENSYGPGTQAVSLFVAADRAIFKHCRFLGWQDTLYVNGPGCLFVPQPLAATDAANCPAGRHYFEQCYIEGHVDFIFGNGASVFRQCEIHSKGAGYVTAQSRTYPAQASGFVFDDCRLTGENTGTGVYLGRPWRAYSHIIFLRCRLDGHIRPEGWGVWNGNQNHETSFYGEYQSQGPGAQPERRVPWSHQLTAAQAAAYAPGEFLKGSDGWQPAV